MLGLECKREQPRMGFIEFFGDADQAGAAEGFQFDFDRQLEPLAVVAQVDLMSADCSARGTPSASSAALAFSISCAASAAISASEVADRRRMKVREASLRTRVVASP